MMQATKEIMLPARSRCSVFSPSASRPLRRVHFLHEPPVPLFEQPVCARKAGRNETYPNACLASRDKARVIAQERCPEFCSRIYVPVCGLTDRRRLQTYGNSCEAVLAGARVIRQRPCWLQR